MGVEIQHVSAWVMLVAVLAYTLLGGADFGGGVWDLLSFGRRREAQRGLIERAIGPIWEANHVWLIVVIVMLFSCFPPAFGALTTALHAPLTLMLFGIVLRGSSFVFRHYDDRGDRARRVWGLVFSVSSVITPVLLGIVLGASASGRLRFDESGKYLGGVWEGWIEPFPIAVGVLTLAAFAHLAAVYLCVEADEEELRLDFRRRGLWSAVVMFLAGGVVRLTASGGAPEFLAHLGRSWWSWPVAIGAGLLLGGSCAALGARRWAIARLLSVGTVTMLVAGFGLAQFPMLVAPAWTVENAAAPDAMHWIILIALGAGSLILLPSLYYLMRVFKGPNAFALLERRDG